MKKKIIVGITFTIGLVLIVFICLSGNNSTIKNNNILANEEVINENVKEEDIIVEEENEEVESKDEEIITNEVIEEAEEIEIITESENTVVNNVQSNLVNNSSPGSNTNTAENNKVESTTDRNEDTTNIPEDVKTVYKNGTFTGQATGFNGNITVNITILNDKITSIVVTSDNETKQFMEQAKEVINRIIASQNTNVDTVSGATYSSQGIINATKAAMESARN